MEGLDHLEHLDKHLVDELAQVARETVRDELREQTRKQRRTAMLYAASGAVALYAGAAVALTVGLALAIGLPDWAAALITAVILGVVAYALRSAARPHATRPTPEREAELAAAGQGDRVIGGRAPAAPPSGLGVPYPPMPPVAPGAAGVPAPGAGTPAPGGVGPTAPGSEEADPEQPHHRA
ncbi:phage holin family protein [Streptomyces sp. NPDC047043]|uniref:phage holin family protein n=1 Tax=Streptomyces sp. NPDC047043 TaxID=3154497 RepID=UPI0033D98524